MIKKLILKVIDWFLANLGGKIRWGNKEDEK